MNPNKKRLRRTMMFLNAQKPGLIKDPYIYKPDSIMLDLEDAVAENQKDAARFSLYHALKEINYRGCERVVRINGITAACYCAADIFFPVWAVQSIDTDNSFYSVIINFL